MRGRQQVVPLVLTVLCVLGVVATATAATGARVPALALEQSGHWVLNRLLGAVLHVHGGAGQVDAQVDVPPEAVKDGVLTVQGASDGYVVGHDRVWVFDKSTLTVVDSLPTAADEVQIAVEAVGGPYLVYRQAGTVVRLGDPPAVGRAGGPLGAPVHTEDGTVWVQRRGDGAVCAFAAGVVELDCAVHARANASGGLTVTHDIPTVVDADTDAAQLVAGGILGSPTPLGVDLPTDVLVGDRAAAGDLLPVVAPAAGLLQLLDVGGLPVGRPVVRPVPFLSAPARSARPW